MQRRIPTVYMRGGTSKGLFFHKNHLPADPAVRDRVILAAYGSPDPNRRQIDGVGGAVSTTSKAAIISPSGSPEYDVDYCFGQVSIDQPVVDYRANCGNISSAVGPFAVDEGLVKAVEPITRVRIHQVNTDKLIVAEVPVKDGRYDPEGDYVIPGVPGSGGKIALRFADPGGAVTGRLLPTGNLKDIYEVPGIGQVEGTFLDAANPFVIVRAENIGLAGIEIDEIEQRTEIKTVLETIRCQAAVRVGMAGSEEEASQGSQSVPKIALVTSPKPYETAGGEAIGQDDVDLVARMMSMGTLHRSFAVSGSVAAAGAAMIPGTVANDALRESAKGKEMIRLGHPGGVIEVGAVIETRGNTLHYKEALLGRTARRLMEGYVLVPEKYFHL